MDYNKMKRKKNSYMDEFLKRRQKAVDFAVKRDNKSGYKYSKPFYYINDINDMNDKEDFINKKNVISNKQNKKEKTYNNLKNGLIGETKSINNFIINKENINKRKKNSKNSKNSKNNVFRKQFDQLKSDDEELIDILMSNEEKNKKYQDIQNYSINFSTEKNASSKEKMNSKKEQADTNNIYNEKEINNGGFGNNLMIERINETNYNGNINNNKYKDNKEIKVLLTSSNMKNLTQKNKENIIDIFNSNNNNKDNKHIRRNTDNDIYYINNSNDKMYYYEGEENHRFYDSTGVKDYSYNYESYKVRKYYKTKNEQNKSKNFSEPKHIKQKNLFNNKIECISPNKNIIRISDMIDVNDNNRTSKEQDINNNDNILIKSFPYNNRNINIFDSGEKIIKKDEGLNNLNPVKIINESSDTENVSIKHELSKKDDNVVKSGEHIGNEIVEIINDDKSISFSNFYKEKSEKKNNKKDFINNVTDSNDKMNNMLYYKSYNNIKDNYKLNEKEYYLMKKRNESFYRQKEDEKEPNIQSIIDCELSMNEDSINKFKNKVNFVNNLKSTIKIIRHNIVSNKENINLINEIDACYKKIKEKEKNNIILKDYQNNILKLNKNKNTNDHTILFQQKSQRLNHMINNIFDNQNKYTGININQMNFNSNYNNTNPSSFKNILKKTNKNKKEFKIERNKSIKECRLLSNTDINLIVDQNENEKIKIIDEKEFQELKNRNIKSSRAHCNINGRLNDINRNFSGYKKNSFLNNRKDQFFFNSKLNKYNGDYDFLLTSRSIWFYLENKIMPPNEI